MSMLTAQCDRLRETADEVERIKHNNADWLWRDGITLMDAARELRDAADTIEGLRNRLTDVVLCHSDANDDGEGNDWRYCPECGRKVDDET